MISVTRPSRPTALAVNLDTLRAYLRVAGKHDDPVISHLVLSATVALEDAAQIALLTQTIEVKLDYWPNPHGRLQLPIGPVLTPAPVVSVTANGEPISAEIIAGARPTVALSHGPATGEVSYRISYAAGFGTEIACVPDDIHRAIFDQVAVGYDERGVIGHASRDDRTETMKRAIARYRGVLL